MQQRVVTCLALLASEGGGAIADLMALVQAIDAILVLPDQRPPLIDVRVQEDLATYQRVVVALAYEASFGGSHDKKRC